MKQIKFKKILVKEEAGLKVAFKKAIRIAPFHFPYVIVCYENMEFYVRPWHVLPFLMTEYAIRLFENKTVDELVKDEKLELTAPLLWKNIVTCFSEVKEYGELWAKLMQVYMKKANLDCVGRKIVQATTRRADIFQMSNWSVAEARNLLIQCWKYGESLAIVEGLLQKGETVEHIQQCRKVAEEITAEKIAEINERHIAEWTK